MIVTLETLNLDGAHYLTEVTYNLAFPEGKNGKTSHWFAQHPGCEEADHLMRQMDPMYRGPTRYSPNTILRILLTEYYGHNKRSPIYVPRREVKAFRGAVAIARAADNTIPEPYRISALEDYFGEQAVGTMLTHMSYARSAALKKKDEA